MTALGSIENAVIGIQPNMIEEVKGEAFKWIYLDKDNNNLELK